MKPIAIIALILAVPAIFIPAVGEYMAFLSILLAVIASFSKDAFPWAFATNVLNGINLFLMSPAFLMMVDARHGIGALTGLALILPIPIRIAVGIMSKGKKKTATETA